MGNSIARVISNQLYPLIKSHVYPMLDKNLVAKEAKIIKNHLESLFIDMSDAILPIHF